MNNKGWEYNENTKTYVGQKNRVLIDKETGEEIQATQIIKRAIGQKQFWKVYLVDFLQVLGVLESKQIDILIHILEHTNPSNNTFIGTYKRISENLGGVSSATIARVMTKLQAKGFIEKIQNGVWQVSPNIMMKGTDHKKQMLLSYYDDFRQQEQSTNEEQ